MLSPVKKIIRTFLILLCIATTVHAQTDKEIISQGVKAYHEDRYEDAAKLLFPMIKSKYLTGDAEFCIGSMYQHGEWVKEDYELAIKWYKKAISDGNADAMAEMGMMYHYGYGVTKSPKDQIKWYRKAAEKGSGLGQYLLGGEYSFGSILPHDAAEAVRLYKLSADQHCILGLEGMAGVYLDGTGVPKDTAMAVSYYMEGVRQGAIQKPGWGSYSATCLNRIGYSAITGKPLTVADYIAMGIDEGKNKRYTEAFSLLSKIAGQPGFTGEACNWLGYLYDGGLGTQANPEEAFKLFEKGAQMGDTSAEKNLGIMYYAGRGTPQSFTEAFRHFLIAAGKGSAIAQTYTGIMYTRGEGCTQNYTEAIKWYLKSATQGEALAQTNLGIMYENGFGVARNDTAAARWYSKAALQYEVLGEYHLGLCWHNGIGVPRNESNAQFWFAKAAAQGNTQAQELYVKQDEAPASTGYYYTPQQNYTQSTRSTGKTTCSCCHGAGTKITYMSNTYQAYDKFGASKGIGTHYINTACTCCNGTGVR